MADKTIGSQLWGHVIYPDQDGKYSVVEVREWYHTSERRIIERVLTDRVDLSPDVALDLAIELWDESGRPVCLYLKDYGKVMFDDYWESVVGTYPRGLDEVLKYCGYTGLEDTNIVMIDAQINDTTHTALVMAAAMDPRTPRMDPKLVVCLAIPKDAIDVWRKHAETDPSAQGLQYVVGHPITKASIRAYFDIVEIASVKLVFDAMEVENVNYGWYRHVEDAVYINYGAFAPLFVLASLGLGRFNTTAILDSYAGVIVHELTHRAENISGYKYQGRWVQSESSRKWAKKPEGSEVVAQGAEYTGGYALKEFDADNVRKHLWQAFDCDAATHDIQNSATLQAFGNLMYRVELVHRGAITAIRGAYVPQKSMPHLRFRFWIRCPEEVFPNIEADFDASEFDYAWITKTYGSSSTRTPPYERRYVVASGDIYVPATDQTWLERAYLKYPNASGNRNVMIP